MEINSNNIMQLGVLSSDAPITKELYDKFNDKEGYYGNNLYNLQFTINHNIIGVLHSINYIPGQCFSIYEKTNSKLISYEFVGVYRYFLPLESYQKYLNSLCKYRPFKSFEEFSKYGEVFIGDPITWRFKNDDDKSAYNISILTELIHSNNTDSLRLGLHYLASFDQLFKDCEILDDKGHWLPFGIKIDEGTRIE